MAACAIAPNDKRLLARRVGGHLAGLYGKRRSYSPALIKAAMRRCEFPDAWDCWALSLFASRDDFVDHHTRIGEACDYASMHTDMLAAIGHSALGPAGVDASADAGSFDWFDALSAADPGGCDAPDHSV